jgi:hypothetical protein
MHICKPLRRVVLWLRPEISPDDLGDPAVWHMLDKWQHNMCGTIMPMAFHVYGNSHLATPGGKKKGSHLFLTEYGNMHTSPFTRHLPHTHATQATVMYVNLVHYAL